MTTKKISNRIQITIKQREIHEKINGAISIIGGFPICDGKNTTTNKATATLASSCTLTANNINFGTFNPAVTGYVNVTGSLNVVCSKSTAYSVAISFHADGSINSNSNYNGQGDTWAYNGQNSYLMESHSRLMKGQSYNDRL